MNNGRTESDSVPVEQMIEDLAHGYNDEGVDLTLIAAFLRLSPTERIRMAERHAAAVHQLQAAFA